MSSFLDVMFSKGAVPALEKTLYFTEARHRYLLGNIANADTPGFQRKDISFDAFNKELKKAISMRDAEPSRGFRFSEKNAIQELGSSKIRISSSANKERDSVDGVLRHDGNNVDIEKEMAMLVRNSGKGKRAASLLSKLYGQIKLVLSETT